MQIIQNRRHFLAGAAAAGAAGLIGSPTQASAEAPPETTTVRLGRWTVAPIAGGRSTSPEN